jgi:NADH-quinone oxidoreductase subunit G
MKIVEMLRRSRLCFGQDLHGSDSGPTLNGAAHMIRIFVEGKPYNVEEGRNLLQTCLSLGFDIPYFCWHPVLHSVGACRQCAVKQFKDEDDKQGKVIMSCMTPVVDGMRISIEDPEAKAFRANVIEWLMTNHPHDCPVCDEGGECHLQDMTSMSGHERREFRFAKRSHNNQQLGPFINHEMNRCIQCCRCVRFYRDYAGGRDLNVFASHNHVYFGRAEDGALESEFSGNLVEVCPTGVFTDKTFKKHYARPWDLQTSPSVCVHCGLGCNVTPCERAGRLRRVRNRYNGAVNGYFICDRGRFGYGFVNGSGRFYETLSRASGTDSLAPASKEDAVARAANILHEGRAIGVGSPRASLESNWALRALVGADNFYLGVPGDELKLLRTMIDVLRFGTAPSATLREAGEADAVLVLGEDVSNTAPMAALRLRQTSRCEPLKTLGKYGIPSWNDAPARELLQDAKGPLFQVTPFATRLDDCSLAAFRAVPDDATRLASAMANLLDDRFPPVPDLVPEEREFADRVVHALSAAERPLIVSGPSCGSAALILAASAIAESLRAKGRQAKLFFAFPECDSFGAAMLCDKSIDDAPVDVDVLICLENDLSRRMNKPRFEALSTAAKYVIVVDHSKSPIFERAEIVFPSAAFSEGDGTFVNNEGRAQRFVQTYIPQGDVVESWRWFGILRSALGRGEAWATLDDLLREFVVDSPAFRSVPDVAPAADSRFLGQRLPRQQHRASGRTSLNARVNVSEPKIGEDPDSSFTFSMEGYHGDDVPSSSIPSFWKPGWNSVQSVNKFQEEIAGPLRGGDPGIRLIEPGDVPVQPELWEIPLKYCPKKSEFLLVPVYDVFGSEELSNLSEPFAERITEPFVVLNTEDVVRLGVADGDFVQVDFSGYCRYLKVVARPGTPLGAAGVFQGGSGEPRVVLPAWDGIIKGRTYPNTD